MSIYDNTIKSVTEIRTLSAHLTALGKIMATTEDQQLYELIQAAAYDLQYQIQHSIGRPIPTSLMFFPTTRTVQLFEYCKFHKQSKKQEWQVLAERHGWSPPEARKLESASSVVHQERSKFSL